MEKFHGIITALVTPLKDDKVDDAALETLINWQIEEGIHGLVPCGTTGESATLSHAEHRHVVERAVQIAAGRVPIIAGAGANSTREAVSLAQSAQKSGADAILSVTPYYNKPSQEGIYAHFEAIHEASDIPIILYNIPGRSVVDMSDELMAELAKLPRIIGVKDATGNLARVSKLRDLAGKGFLQISGEDMTASGFNAMGGVGCISVSSNVAPRLLAEIQEATLTGKFAEALLMHDKMVALHEAMFCAPSPAPAKYALSLMGKCAADVRLPITQVNEAQKAQIKSAVSALGLV